MSADKDISQEILEYIIDHPDASDTLEGIAEWWLFSQRIRCEANKVKAAVGKLVKEGWILEVKGKDSAVRYRLNPERRKKTTPHL
jgi:hypothetical protein